MRTILFILQKEFLQIFRNKAILPILTIMPIVQLIVLSFAASHEVKNVKLAIQNQDQSLYAERLISKIEASGQFIISALPVHAGQSVEMLENNEADIILVIPADFEANFLRNRSGQLQLLVNAINGSKAGIATGYLQTIIQNFRMEIVGQFAPQAITVNQIPTLEVTYSNWYNPELEYTTFMVPGILGELVTLLVMVLSAMNIVREKEIGTIEQLNVTPIRKSQLLVGKLLPFLIIGLADLTIGLIVGKLIFDIPMEGSLWLVFFFCIVNINVVLGIGLLISTKTETQQQAMFVSWFFMMIFILMSGLFTPIESMPKWAQYLTIPNPVAHFVTVMRQVLLKGANFWDIQYHFYAMISLGLFFNLLSIWSYRKTN